MSSMFGTRSRKTADVAEFRTARMFTSLPHLYGDLKVRTEEGNETTLADCPEGIPVSLTQYRSSDRDAVIKFKRVKIGGDDQKVYDLRWHQDRIDWDVYNQQAAARVDAKILSEMLEPAVRTTLDIATLEHFVTAYQGEFARIPAPYEDENGEKIVPFRNADFFGDDTVPAGLDPDAPHEMAGQIPPIEAPWIELWDESLRVELLTEMNAVHGGKSPSQAVTFPRPPLPPEPARPVPLRRGASRTQPA